MIHEVPIKWHDLIEDPNDLPKQKGYYMLTLYHKKSEKTYLDMGDSAYYCANKIWKACPANDLYYDSIDDWDDYAVTYPHIEIIAWAELPEAYRRNDNA